MNGYRSFILFKSYFVIQFWDSFPRPQHGRNKDYNILYLLFSNIRREEKGGKLELFLCWCACLSFLIFFSGFLIQSSFYYCTRVQQLLNSIVPKTLSKKA